MKYNPSCCAGALLGIRQDTAVDGRTVLPTANTRAGGVHGIQVGRHRDDEHALKQRLRHFRNHRSTQWKHRVTKTGVTLGLRGLAIYVKEFLLD